MSTRLRIAAVLAAAGLLAIFVVPSAEAVSAPTSGWWSRLATTTPTDEAPAALPVPVPAAPDTIPAGSAVPAGQLLVEGTAEGATAVAAIRWTLDDGDSGSSLTLNVAPGSTLNPQSIVLACKAAAPWTAPPAPGGRWDTKPLVDASRCVNGVIAPDVASVTFGLQPLASADTLDVVLTPGKDPALAVPAGVPQPPVDASRSTFRWMTDAPKADSLKVVAGSGFSEGDGNQFVVPTPSPTPEFGPAEDVGFTPPIDVAPAPSPSFDSPPVAAPALEPEDLAPSVPDVRKTVRTAVTSPAANRTIGFVLLALSALMAAWAYWTADGDPGTIGLGRFARPVPDAGALGGGPAAEPVVGGLSRFARPRSSPPPSLS